MFHLIVEKFTEIFHINSGFGGIYHSDKAVQGQLLGFLLHSLHRCNHIGQLAYAGWLNDNAVGVVLVQNLL